MTYSWNVLNGTPEGSTANTLFAFTLGQKGYSAVRLTSHLGDSSTSMAAIIRVDAAPTVSSLTSRDVNTNETETISWQVSSDATTGTLYGSDFPSQGLTVNLAAGSYSYTADSAGSKWVELVVGNGCGSTSKRSTYDVVTPAPSGSITASPSLIVFGGTSTLTIVVENVPAGVEWKLRSAIGNVFGFESGGNTGFGSGTFTRLYGVANEYGLDTITLEVDGVVIGSTQIQMFSADVCCIERTQVLGTSRAFTVTINDLPATKRWTLRSAGGSTFDNPAGMGSGSFPRTVHFHTAIAGIETLSLEVDGVVIVQVPVQVVSGSIVANPTTLVFGGNANLTVTVTNLEIPASRGWVLRSGNGNLFDVVGGAGSGTFPRTFHAIVRSGLDTLSLEADGVVITTTQIQVN